MMLGLVPLSEEALQGQQTPHPQQRRMHSASAARARLGYGAEPTRIRRKAAGTLAVVPAAVAVVAG
jgi:hypothetical protein